MSAKQQRSGAVDVPAEDLVAIADCRRSRVSA